MCLTVPRQECFNSPYGTKHFPHYAEAIPGPTTEALSATARECKVYLVGGSHPELGAEGRFYNTCTAYDRAGKLVAVHRKVHLFDIDVPGKITFKESEVLRGGSSFTSFDTEYGRIGLGVCYDIRFPELCLAAVQQGALFSFLCYLLVSPSQAAP